MSYFLQDVTRYSNALLSSADDDVTHTSSPPPPPASGLVLKQRLPAVIG